MVTREWIEREYGLPSIESTRGPARRLVRLKSILESGRKELADPLTPGLCKRDLLERIPVFEAWVAELEAAEAQR